MSEAEAKKVYGSHLMFLVQHVEKPERLDDPDLLREFLCDLVKRIGMRVLDGPHTTSESGDDAHYGHSGVVILKESHAAIHTYPLLRSFFLDVFSCRFFEPAEVKTTCEDFFGTFEITEDHLLDRGTHWPAPATARLNEWTATRQRVPLSKGSSS